MRDMTGDESNLSFRLDAVEQEVKNMEKRLRVVEQEGGEYRARGKERDIRLFSEIETLEKSLRASHEELKGKISKLEGQIVWPVRIVGGAILASVGAYVVNGGFSAG